jgi:predicted HicB family RNase H-like nuclease
MPKKNSTVKAVRIDNDKLALLEGRLGDQSINSWMNERIEKFLQGEEEGKPQTKEIKELTSMTTYYGLTNEEFVRMVVRGLTDGYLTVEGGMVVGTPKMQLDEFIDACHERGLEPQETLDRTTVTLRRGK